MPATDIEKLVVQLSADVRGYQKSLDKARQATNRTAGDIEKRFNRMNKSVSTLGAGLKSAFAGFGAGLASSLTVGAIGNLIKQFGDLNDKAAQVGVSAEALQELGFAARQNGAEIDDLVKSLGTLQRKVGEAQQKQKGPLFEIFAANQKQFSTDVTENFRTIADLIRNARTEADKFVIATAAFGKGGQVLIPLLEQGGEAIERLQKQIRDSGGVLSNELVAKADEFAERWENAFNNFKVIGAASVIQVIEEVEKLIDKGGEFGALLEKILSLLPQVKLGEPFKIGTTGGGLLGALGVGEQTFFGGTPLDQAKEKVKDLQDELHKLVGEDAPVARLEALRAQIRAAQEDVARLQAALNGLGNTNTNIQFGGPTTGPASPNFTRGVPTIIPPGSGDDEASSTFDKAVDKFVQVVIDFESKGNVTAKNPLSSATGLGQFIESTWLDLFKKNFPDRAKSMSDATILALRNDAATSIALIKSYATENGKILQNAGVAVTEANLQLSHFLGPGGALKVLQAAPGTPVENVLGPEVIAANRGVLAGKTTDEIIREANARAGLSGAIRDNNAALAELASSNNADIDAMRVKAAELGAVTEAQKIYAREMELTNQLQAQGIPITAELKTQIHEAAVKYGEQAQQLENVKLAQEQAAESAKQLQEAQEQAAQTAQAVAGAFGSAFQGFISDLAHGKKLTDALRDALLKLGESLLNIALDNLLGGIGGGGGAGGGLLGGLFGGGGGAGGLLGGLFHNGGIVGSGGHGRRVPALAFAGAPRFHGGGFAGLQQGEVPAILKRGEIVFPNMDAVRNAVGRQGGAGRGGIVQNNTFVAPSWKAAERSQNQIARTAGASLERVKRTL